MHCGTERGAAHRTRRRHEHAATTNRCLLAVLTLAGSLGTVVAGAAGASPGVGHPHHTMAFATETLQFAVVDVGPPGPALGVGDEIVSSDTVYQAGKAVGTDGVVCVVVRSTPYSITCQWTMTMVLPAGQLTLQGLADGPAGPPTTPLHFSMAVTGGTGLFVGAQGVAEIVDNPGGREEIEIRLER